MEHGNQTTKFHPFYPASIHTLVGLCWSHTSHIIHSQAHAGVTLFPASTHTPRPMHHTSHITHSQAHAEVHSKITMSNSNSPRIHKVTLSHSKSLQLCLASHTGPLLLCPPLCSQAHAGARHSWQMAAGSSTSTWCTTSSPTKPSPSPGTMTLPSKET